MRLHVGLDVTAAAAYDWTVITGRDCTAASGPAYPLPSPSSVYRIVFTF